MASFLQDLYADIIWGMCSSNCSGHGDCLNGTCFCEIQFAGDECGGVNMNYHIGLASVYLLVALVSLCQLTVAITMSCRQVSKGNRIREALSPTTPKVIYAIIFLAASLRAAYFAVSTTVASDWLLSLLSAYYPLLLTGSSLIVCFWAEVFHLRNVCFESHRFLSKSFLGFLAFNVITYSILLAQLLLVLANRNETEKGYYLNVFNGCYAVLLFIVVVFFLIYGVEVYFKVNDSKQPVDISQLNQSRLGLISQASMLLVTVVFILSDILGEFWKSKVPVEGRNYHDIIFRAVEVGVALWFPCCLWNVNRPDQLWILNPKKILKTPTKNTPDGQEEKYSLSDNVGCYFCYDPERKDAGPLIQPCECRGDVATVHHECLRRWLLQRAAENGPACCSVCKTPYKLEREKPLSWSACTEVSAAHWLRFSLMIAAISGIFMSTWALCHILPSPPYRILVVVFGIIGTYVILKFLGQNTFSAYQQAKVSSVKIISRTTESLVPETKI
ncbi:E3 ubiquitin-protein ligase MIR1 [Orchesella cincta]|uniref:E3 ubiquitin-protein ligase MIR1 n=1 Tax=Orchesella cincta TaxID=48709 RepID=A0A1D2NJ48_ORCCI|nr:E3 ubiquitin-protein ligase MIR1 [Orchesella cincta]